MATYNVPKTEFVPHPMGQHQGLITEFEDLGEVETSFGKRYQGQIKIESRTANMEDGRPFIIIKRFTLSSHEKSNLYKFRTTMMGRKLSDHEKENFDDQEILNRQIGFIVSHNEGHEGGIFANIDNIWPLPESQAQAAQQSPQQQVDNAFGGPPPAATAPGAAGPPTDVPSPTEDDDLPF